MKKRLVAITLSLVMTMATVSEAGAATFTSADSETVSVQTEETTEEQVTATEDVEDTSEPVVTETDESSEAEDIFSSGDEGSEVISQDEQEDVFSAGTDSGITTQPDQTANATTDNVSAEDAVNVKAEDWVNTEKGFKLRKPVEQQKTEDEQKASEEAAQNASEDISEAEAAESAADVLTDTVDAAEADTDAVIADTVDTDAANTDAVDTDAADTTDADAADADAAADTDKADTDTASEFFTAEDGIVKICTEYKGTSHTGYYLFDKDGILVTGQAEVAQETATVDATDSADADEAQQPDQVYFTTAEEAAVYEGCEGETVTPYASTVGQQQKNVWKWTGTVFQYYDANGKLETIASLEQKAKADGTYTGYFKINGEYYCLDENGKPRTGDITLTVNGESNLYYFEKTGTIPGRMFHEGWRRADDAKGERWLYYNQGKAKPENVGKYYKRGVTATILGPEKGTAVYLIDGNGYVLKSALRKAANGAYYGTDKNGVIYTNALVKFGNYRYYFGSSGKRASWKRRWVKVGNHYYYFGNVSGRVAEKHGWRKITNTNGKFIGWFYFDANGNHYTDKWSSEGYYFTPTGKLASGFVEINGKGYLFEVSTATVRKGKVYKGTMVRYKKKWYLASASGELYKNGWKRFNKNYYYLKNYVVQTNQFMSKKGVNGYLDANGKYTTGWVVVSNKTNLVKYIDPDGTGFVTNTSKRINGILYYFDKNGYRITDLTSRYSGPYTVQVDRVNGVMTVFADSARTIPVKTIRVSVGLAGTPTPTGSYTLARSARWQALMGPSWGQYGTHVEGAGQGGIFVHSVACSLANSYNLPAAEYNKLGYPASHGCIRVCVADAKWVYENCNGSRIYIFDGTAKADDALKGPLGKKPLTPLRGAGNFDPTDPAV